MKTACGAVLIASQFTDTVEWGGGGTAKNDNRPDTNHATARDTATIPAEAGENSNRDAASSADDIQIEYFYSLTGEDGNPLAQYRYDLHVDGALHTKAAAYANGASAVIGGAVPSQLTTWLDKDSLSKT